MGTEDEILKDPFLREVPELDGFKILDPCVLYARIGKGGMGAVYRGRHVKFDMDVGVKCLLPHLAQGSEQIVLRFEREAQLAARLNHPNLVRVFDVDHRHGVHYLVMEYVRGETARERVGRKGQLNIGEAVTIALQASKGLAAAHTRGIVHRDIKPDNILISREGEVKLADLGLGNTREAGGSGLTVSDVTMGTPRYMPPEQWDGLNKVGPPGDVWAMGATLYFLLAGGDAYEGDSMTSVMKKVCSAPFPLISDVRKDIPQSVIDIINKSTASDAEDRYPEAQDLVEALEGVVKAEDLKGTLSDPLTGTGTQRCELVSPPPAELLAKVRVQLDEETKSSTKGEFEADVTQALPSEMAAPSPSPKKAPPPPVQAEKSRTMLWVILVLILIGLGGGGFYILSDLNKDSGDPLANTNKDNEDSDKETPKQPENPNSSSRTKNNQNEVAITESPSNQGNTNQENTEDVTEKTPDPQVQMREAIDQFSSSYSTFQTAADLKNAYSSLEQKFESFELSEEELANYNRRLIELHLAQNEAVEAFDLFESIESPNPEIANMKAAIDSAIVALILKSLAFTQPEGLNEDDPLKLPENSIQVAGGLSSLSKVHEIKIQEQVVSLNDGQFQLEVKDLPEGKTQLTVEVTYSNGDGPKAQAEYPLYVDTLAPTLTLESGDEKIYLLRNPLSLKGQVSDGSNFTLTVDGKPVEVTEGEFNAEITLIKDELTVLTVVAEDELGRKSEQKVQAFLDSQPPVITLLEPNPNQSLVKTKTLNLLIQVEDGGGVKEVYLDDQLLSPNPEGVYAGKVEVGNKHKQVVVRAIDNLNRESEAKWVFLMDIKPPVFNAIGFDRDVQTGKWYLKGVVSDNHTIPSKLKLTIDEKPIKIKDFGSFSYMTESKAATPPKLSIMLSDEAGNEAEPPADRIMVRVDPPKKKEGEPTKPVNPKEQEEPKNTEPSKPEKVVEKPKEAQLPEIPGFKALKKNAEGLPEYRHEKTGIIMVQLPKGKFQQGSKDGASDEAPVHEVELDSFLIAKYEVSQSEWDKVLRPNPSQFKGGNLPVENVHWKAAETFCKISGLSLPSESQWEYAARAGSSDAFSFGKNLTQENANFSAGNKSKTVPVNSLKPNAFGLHHMHGNVAEWCRDIYNKNFYASKEAKVKNPVANSGSVGRVFRGGGFTSKQEACRSSARGAAKPELQNPSLGFRPVFELK